MRKKNGICTRILLGMISLVGFARLSVGSPAITDDLNNFDPTYPIGIYILELSSNVVDNVVTLTNNILTVEGQSIEIPPSSRSIVTTNGHEVVTNEYQVVYQDELAEYAQRSKVVSVTTNETTGVVTTNWTEVAYLDDINLSMTNKADAVKMVVTTNEITFIRDWVSEDYGGTFYQLSQTEWRLEQGPSPEDHIYLIYTNDLWRLVIGGMSNEDYVSDQPFTNTVLELIDQNYGGIEDLVATNITILPPYVTNYYPVVYTQDLTWNNITNTPSTLGGYGITNAVLNSWYDDEVNQQDFWIEQDYRGVSVKSRYRGDDTIRSTLIGCNEGIEILGNDDNIGLSGNYGLWMGNNPESTVDRLSIQYANGYINRYFPANQSSPNVRECTIYLPDKDGTLALESFVTSRTESIEARLTNLLEDVVLIWNDPTDFSNATNITSDACLFTPSAVGMSDSENVQLASITIYFQGTWRWSETELIISDLNMVEVARSDSYSRGTYSSAPMTFRFSKGVSLSGNTQYILQLNAIRAAGGAGILQVPWDVVAAPGATDLYVTGEGGTRWRPKLQFGWMSHTYWTRAYETESHKFCELPMMKELQVPVVDPEASGITNAFIDSISQDASGMITATKKTVTAESIGAYEKPFGGIPEDDLDATVQAKLQLLDPAIGSWQDSLSYEGKVYFNKPILFYPRAFGMPDGAAITSFSILTRSGDYPDQYKTNIVFKLLTTDGQTVLAQTDSVYVSEPSTTYTFTFTSAVNLWSDCQYKLQAYNADSGAVPYVGYAIQDTSSSPDLCFETRTNWRPKVTVVWNRSAAYFKPAAGIPESDFTTNVQRKLKVAFCVCDTPDSQMIKSALTIPGFDFSTDDVVDGARIYVYFSNKNTNPFPALRINNMPQKVFGMASSRGGTNLWFSNWNDGEIVEFIVYGSYVYAQKPGYATVSSYGQVMLSDSVGTSDGSRYAATPSAVYKAYSAIPYVLNTSLPPTNIINHSVSYWELTSMTNTIQAFIGNNAWTTGVRDWYIDVKNSYAGTATMEFAGFGSNPLLATADGTNITALTTLEQGEMARYHFTETAFTGTSGTPIFLVTKQTINIVEPTGGTYQIETDGSVTTDGMLNIDGTLTIDGSLNNDGTVTVEAL